NEFTGDISVWGSRTNDVTHYLGQTRIPSLRHLDIGFPGNQSVLNPRLLKSITLSDNMAKGPINQGNASALVYDLKEGDPNNITGDLVFGTVNREINLTGYWGGRTFIASGRYLEPTFLSNLGGRFFTEPRDARLGTQGESCREDCPSIKEPFKYSTMDGYLGTLYRDSTGACARHSILALNDSYKVIQDVSLFQAQSVPQVLVEGSQDGWTYAYEAYSPRESGDLQYAFGFMQRNREEAFRDTLPSGGGLRESYPWYFSSGGTTVDNLIGDADVGEIQATTSFQWNSNGRLLGAAYGYGFDLEYLSQVRNYIDLSPVATGGGLLRPEVPQDYAMSNALLRLRWSLSQKQTLEAAAGAAFVYQGLMDGADAGIQDPAPLASLRYTRPVGENLLGYGEMALRQNTSLQPTGLDRLEALTTSSVEAKVGAE